MTHHIEKRKDGKSRRRWEMMLNWLRYFIREKSSTLTAPDLERLQDKMSRDIAAMLNDADETLGDMVDQFGDVTGRRKEDTRQALLRNLDRK